MSYMFPVPTLVDDADVWVKDGDEIETCGYTFQVIDTAGHTPGGISFYMKREGLVFTGDSLFRGPSAVPIFPAEALKS